MTPCPTFPCVSSRTNFLFFSHALGVEVASDMVVQDKDGGRMEVLQGWNIMEYSEDLLHNVRGQQDE